MKPTFRPDYASPPGETLVETIEAMGLTQTELARRMGRPIKTINEIIQGKAALTAGTALELERVLGVPASFWNGLESNYRDHLARQKAAEKLEVDDEWLGQIPIAAMQKRGWLTKTKEKRSLMEEILCFFGCASVETWRDAWGEPAVAYRKSAKLESEPAALAAWLRKAEQEGRKQQCAPYKQEAFKAALERLRKATTQPVEKWVETIRTECNACGVAYVLLPELPGACVSGAARQIKDDCMLIVQSGRFKDDGHFWFTFFHEARHVLQGKLRDWLVDNKEYDGPLEEDANRFAREFLVPTAAIRAMRQRNQGKMPETAGAALAEELGVSPGIVVGRLQHDKIWKQFTGAKLKRRFEIEQLIGTL